MKRFIAIISALALFLTSAPVAFAQTAGTTKVVGTCGTAVYTAGKAAYPTQDTSGNACTTASVSFSGAVTIANGADVAQGSIGDTAWVSGNGTVIAVLKAIANYASSALAAGSAIIGKVGIDQTTPGTTNNVTVSTNVGTLPLVQATASAAISTTAAAGPTQLIGASGSTKIYVTHYNLVLSGAGTFAWVTGTGTNCGTGTAYMTGSSGHPMSFAANGGIADGVGLGPILITGAGGELCYITTGSVDISGSVAYAQF